MMIMSGSESKGSETDNTCQTQLYKKIFWGNTHEMEERRVASAEGGTIETPKSAE